MKNLIFLLLLFFVSLGCNKGRNIDYLNQDAVYSTDGLDSKSKLAAELLGTSFFENRILELNFSFLPCHSLSTTGVCQKDYEAPVFKLNFAIDLENLSITSDNGFKDTFNCSHFENKKCISFGYINSFEKLSFHKYPDSAYEAYSQDRVLIDFMRTAESLKIICKNGVESHTHFYPRFLVRVSNEWKLMALMTADMPNQDFFRLYDVNAYKVFQDQMLLKMYLLFAKNESIDSSYPLEVSSDSNIHYKVFNTLTKEKYFRTCSVEVINK